MTALGRQASILHPYQIQPVRRRDGAAGGAVAGGECSGEIVGAPAALAGPDQSSHHRTHLAVEERARRSDDVDGVAVSDDVALLEGSFLRLCLALPVAEARDI